MSTRTCIVQSEGLESAKALGLAQLHAQGMRAEVLALGEGSFQVEVLEAPYLLELALSEDRMQAIATCVAQAVGDHPRLDSELLTQGLASLGVRGGILQAEIEDLLTRLEVEPVIQGAVLAQGEPAQSPSPPKLRLMAKPGQIVRHGERVAEVLEESQTEPGWDLLGAALGTANESGAAHGAGITRLQGEPYWCADVPGFGYLALDGAGRLAVQAAIAIGLDLLTASLELRPPVGDEKPLERTELVAALRDSGVTQGLDGQLLNQLWSAFEAGREHGIPMGIAKGIPPGPPQDEELQIIEPDANMQAFGERELLPAWRRSPAFHFVAKGECFGHWLMPRQGISGVGVDGSVLRGKMGASRPIQVGSNVNIRRPDEERKLLVAGTAGVLSLLGGTVSVVDLLQIPGDVGTDTGNLDLRGSLLVEGSIRSGFKVNVECDIFVGQSIEAGQVRAGGDIVVCDGIIGGDGGSVLAGGDLSLTFSQNASLQAGGDVHIGASDSNSSIECNGKILALHGPGTLRSGNYFAQAGMRVRELGSELGALTRVSIGMEAEWAAELGGLIDERKSLSEGMLVERSSLIAAQGSMDELDQEGARWLRQSILAKRKKAVRLQEIEMRLGELKELLDPRNQPILEVLGSVHNHVEVSMAGTQYHFLEAQECVRIGFDRSTKKIQVSQLI